MELTNHRKMFFQLGDSMCKFVPQPPSLVSLVQLLESVKTDTIEQKALLLDLLYGVKSLLRGLSSVDQLIIVAEVFKIRELMFATFRTHPQHSLIVSIYEEVEKYV
jgi:hypothetical protein